MRSFVTILFIVTINFASNTNARHNSQGRVGSDAEILVSKRSAGQPTFIEVRTDPNITKNSEMMVYCFPPEGRGNAPILRHLVPASKLGLYHLEIDFPRQGKWDVSFRYGIGLDLYYTSLDINIGSLSNADMHYQQTFRGDLEQGTPKFIQPLGFSIFGLVLVIVFGLTVGILNRLKNAYRKNPLISGS